MSHSPGAHAPAREGRREAETITIPAIPQKPPSRAPRSRRRLFPNGWQDVAWASMALFFLLLNIAVLHFLFHLGGHS
jgi:hypothetical protein